MNISGIFPPLTTSFVDGKVAADKIAENIERYKNYNFGGFVILGSTGEAAFLTEAEREVVWRTARAAIPDGKPMIAGAGVESTEGTIRLVRVAADCGADLVLIVTPNFFKKLMNDDALIAHYTAVADTCPIPVLLYNNPLVTGVEISTRAVSILSGHDNIAGIKDSSGSITYLLDLKAKVPEDFIILCGGALVFQPALAAGAQGGILAISNVLPEAFIRIWEKNVKGETEEALSLQKAIANNVKLMLSRYGVPGIKAGMDIRGLYGGPPREPLLPVSKEERDVIESQIEDLLSNGIISRKEI